MTTTMRRTMTSEGPLDASTPSIAEDGPPPPSHRQLESSVILLKPGAELDDTGHRVRGGGVLASLRDINIPPAQFAEGCKLLQAAAKGDRRNMEVMLKHHPAHVNFRDYDRRTALHVAASEGHLGICIFLVERGASINRSDRWGGSPLDDAHRHRHAQVVHYLRSRGATTGSADHTTNLITAAAEGDMDEVRMLINDSHSNAIKNRTTHVSYGDGQPVVTQTPDINPCNNNNLSKSVKRIDINAGDYDNRTALHLAAGEGHAEVVELLCRSGADVNKEDRWGGRPLDDAIRQNHTDCEDILVRYGAESTAESAFDQAKQSTNGSGKQVDILDDPHMKIDFSEIELIEKIGAGAFGEIYKCRWRGILVAAKCIKSAKIRKDWMQKQQNESSIGRTYSTHSDDPDTMTSSEKDLALADFRQETAILRKLRHPNICMLLAYSTTENFEVMISELMKCSLLDVFKANSLHNTHLTKRKQITYAQQLAQGMNYLHTCKPPIIHRDLKPANLLVDFSGMLKITDFGLAKIRPDPERKEKDQFLMTGETGSYRFMAPEVFRHEEYNETVDVYSYAMILFYLLSGKAPWYMDNGLVAVNKAAIEGDRPFIPRDWDSRLSHLLKQSWDENPRHRPPFRDILTTLSEYSQDVFKTRADSVAGTDDDNTGCNCVIS